jgi:hypothetical protein
MLPKGSFELSARGLSQNKASREVRTSASVTGNQRRSNTVPPQDRQHFGVSHLFRPRAWPRPRLGIYFDRIGAAF